MASIRKKGQFEPTQATDVHVETVSTTGYDIVDSKGAPCIAFVAVGNDITALTVRTVSDPDTTVTYGAVTDGVIQPIALTEIVSCTPSTSIRFLL